MLADVEDNAEQILEYMEAGCSSSASVFPVRAGWSRSGELPRMSSLVREPAIGF